MPLTFIKACETYDPEAFPNGCEMASSKPRHLDIPAQCPQCHFQATHNHFRALYGMTRFNIEHILSQLDRVDLVRDSLNGADLHARNALEHELQSLQQHPVRCAERFSANRDVAIQAFLGPFERAAHSLHSTYMEQSGCWAGPSEVEHTGHMQVPAYDDQGSTSAALIVPSVDINRSQPADTPPLYFQLFPHKSEEPFRPQESQQNDESLEELESVSSDSHGGGLDHVEVLRRLIRKLEGELKELSCVPENNTESMFNFTPEQMTSKGSLLTFASQHQREQRESQVRSQLDMLRNILREESLILLVAHAFEGLVVSAQIFPAQGASVASLRRRICFLIGLLYGNRYQAGLGELLVPLNGTDPSSAHSITLLPGSIFSAKVTGFPQYVEGQLDNYERVEYEPMFDDLCEVLPFAAELLGNSDPTVPEPDRVDSDHSPLQQLTEVALQSHNGDPPLPAQPTVSYRMHARNIIFNMEQWPAQLPDGYPDIRKTVQDGMPIFVPLLSPTTEQRRQHILPFPSTPSGEEDEPEPEPGAPHPLMPMPDIVSDGSSPEASGLDLLSDGRVTIQTLLRALDSINELLQEPEAPAWRYLEGLFTGIHMLNPILCDLMNSDDPNEHTLVADLLTRIWESSVLMSRHPTSRGRDECLHATRDLQTTIRDIIDGTGANFAPESPELR